MTRLALHPRQLAPAATAIVWRRDLLVPAAYCVAGFAPITALALAIIGLAPLHLGSLVIVLPAIVLATLLSLQFPSYGRRFVIGLGIGVAATFAYDLTRLPFIITGTWQDFIPHIGGLLLNRDKSHWLAGYLWRWLGNGGGMGAAFFMLYPAWLHRLECRKAALLYGIVIWLCLMGTLLISPAGEGLLFRLTPKTITLSLLGHLVYGVTLGVLTRPLTCRC